MLRSCTCFLMLVSTDMAISGMFFHCLRTSYESGLILLDPASIELQTSRSMAISCPHFCIFSYFLYGCCFIFLGSWTFTVVTLSVSSKTVASSSKWQLNSSSTAYLLASSNTDRNFLFVLGLMM